MTDDDGAAHRRTRRWWRHSRPDGSPPRLRPRAHRPGAAADALGADRGRRQRRVHRLVLRAFRAAGRGEHAEDVPVAPREPARADPLAGRDLRQRRQHREHARDLARARHRRADARGVGEGRRPVGRERRDDLLVRGGRHRLVRAAARRDGVPRLPARAARARTTTARSAGGRAIRSSSRTGYPPGSQPTTASRSTTSARSCTRSSPAARDRRVPSHARTAKSGSRRASSAD